MGLQDLLASESGRAAAVHALIPLSCFALTGAALLAHLQWIQDSIEDTLDRLLLGVIVGAAFMTSAAMALEGFVGIPVSPMMSWSLCGAAVFAALVHKRFSWLGRPSLQSLFVLATLLAIYYLAYDARLLDTLKQPDVLLDADPYRHHAWSRHILETGEIPAFAPLMVGQQPEFSFQLHYILAGIMGQLGDFSAWQMWKYGSLALSAFGGTFGGYLLGRYALGKRGGSALAGLFCALLLATTPVHILRGKLGFAETYAVPFLAPAILFYIRFLRTERLTDAALWGLLFTTMIGCNMPNGVFLAPLFTAALVAAQVLRWKQSQSLIPLKGAFTALGIFLVIFIIWKLTLFPVSLFAGLKATGAEGTQQMQGQNFDLWNEVLRNAGWANLVLAGAGLLILLALRKTEEVRALLPAGPEDDPDAPEGRVAPSGYWLMWGYLAAMSVWFVLLMVATKLGLGTFTPRYHRYMFPAVHGYALVGGLGLAAACGVSGNFLARLIPAAPAVVFRGIALLVLAGATFWGAYARVGAGKAWGSWGLTFTPSEYAAARWLRDNTGPDDIVVANWYTCDLVRSIARRRTIASTYLRTNFRHLVKHDPSIDLKSLGSEADVRDFADAQAEQSRKVWVVKDKWGPSLRLVPQEGFFEVESFGRGKDLSTIYRVDEPQLDPIPPPKPGERRNLARGALPEAGAVSGKVLRVSAINDGTLGTNTDDDVAVTDPRTEKPVESWFGVRFKTPEIVNEVRVTTGWFKDPETKKQPAMQYIAYESVIEWRDEGGGWHRIEGTEVKGGDTQDQVHKFPPITAHGMRIHVFKSRDWRGGVNGTIFRTGCLEFEAYGPESVTATSPTASSTPAAASGSPSAKPE